MSLIKPKINSPLYKLYVNIRYIYCNNVLSYYIISYFHLSSQRRGDLGEMSRRRIEPLDTNHSFILPMIIRIKIVNL